MNELLPRLPFADWIDSGVDWLVSTFGSVFDGIADVLGGVVEGAVIFWIWFHRYYLRLSLH